MINENFKRKLSKEMLLPIGSVILNIDYQNYILHVWYLAMDTKHKQQRNFRIVETGDEIDDEDIFNEKLKFINTAITSDGKYVKHVFEEV